MERTEFTHDLDHSLARYAIAFVSDGTPEGTEIKDVGLISVGKVKATDLPVEVREYIGSQFYWLSGEEPWLSDLRKHCAKDHVSWLEQMQERFSTPIDR